MVDIRYPFPCITFILVLLKGVPKMLTNLERNSSALKPGKLTNFISLARKYSNLDFDISVDEIHREN